MDYQKLDYKKILETMERLSKRITERFPARGLRKVAEELMTITHQSQGHIAYVSKPIIYLRVLNGFVITAIVASLIGSIWALNLELESLGLAEFVQVLEAGINDVVLIGASIFFLVTLETRIKRNRVLKALDKLRAIIHVIDMHQLTKDPDRVLKQTQNTPSSPKASMNVYELSRYLDYCSELLSLSSKVAALYVQNFNDSVALASVNELETLTTGLSRKIWQKLMIIHTIQDKINQTSQTNV